MSMGTIEPARRRVTVVRGPRARATKEHGIVDFAQFIKEGRFEDIVKDLQSGRNPSRVVNLSDIEGNGLRVKIRPTGRVSFHCQYTAPDPAEGEEFELDEAESIGGRPAPKIGIYPRDDIKIVRQRAATVTGLAERGIDIRRGLFDRLVRELDERGLKWKPW